MEQNNEQVIAQFVERVGLIAQADGLPRIAGRIMGLLVIYGGPFSFAELAKRLQVSRGSISTNSRLLENLGVIERVARPGDRQDYFQIRSEPYLELLKGSLGRLYKAREAVADTKRKLPDDWSDAQGRLADLDAFYSGLIERTEALIGPK
jgi:DNA-binding transcriptional regulator GbsR (MarR family)